MKAALRQRARELGFDDCRITSAEAPESATHFHQWLVQGRHGQMAWLERTRQSGWTRSGFCRGHGASSASQPVTTIPATHLPRHPARLARKWHLTRRVSRQPRQELAIGNWQLEITNRA